MITVYHQIYYNKQYRILSIFRINYILRIRIIIKNKIKFQSTKNWIILKNQ